MKEYNRDYTISWLESNADNGAFDGFLESELDFSKLEDEELMWYWDNWAMVGIEGDNQNEENN